jgi:hypothetical protein
VSSWTRPWGEDSGPFGCPQHPSVQASARVKAPLAQAQWKRPNRRFPQGQAGQRQKTPRNLPRSHAWRNSGRRGITALIAVSVQSPLLSRPINRSHPWTHRLCLHLLRLPLRSRGLRRGPSSSSTATRKTWAGWRRRLDCPQSQCSDDRRRMRRCAGAPTRASMAAAAADEDRVADLPTGRFEPPPLRFDPLLPIDPRRLAEINAGAPGGSRETATVVHSSQRRRVELSRFAPYPLPSSGVRIEPMAPPPPAVAPTLAPSPASATPPPRRQQVFPPSPRGKFSCLHGLNPRFTRVF